MGPSYRVNEFVSLYGLAGTAHGKIKASGTDFKESATGFAYGAGVQIAPAANWTVDIGYEGSGIKEAKLNGFNIGLGYRF